MQCTRSQPKRGHKSLPEYLSVPVAAVESVRRKPCCSHGSPCQHHAERYSPSQCQIDRHLLHEGSPAYWLASAGSRPQCRHQLPFLGANYRPLHLGRDRGEALHRRIRRLSLRRARPERGKRTRSGHWERIEYLLERTFGFPFLRIGRTKV